MIEKYIEIPVYEGAIAPKINVAQTASGATITVISNGQTTTANITNGAKGDTGETGPQGPTGATGAAGKSFDIVATFANETEMNAHLSEYSIGDFVAIRTSINDPNNAKLYKKDEVNGVAQWIYIVDMSGRDGIDGTDGQDGRDGRDGIDGIDGRGIAHTSSTTTAYNMSLVITYTDGTAETIPVNWLPVPSKNDIGKSLKVLRSAQGNPYWGIG